MRHREPHGPLDRALDPEWWATVEVKFLRNISDALEWLVWSKTEDGRRGVNMPKPTLLTEAEKRRADPDRGKWTAVPIEQIDAMLGWTKGGGAGGWN